MQGFIVCQVAAQPLNWSCAEGGPLHQGAVPVALLGESETCQHPAGRSGEGRHTGARGLVLIGQSCSAFTGAQLGKRVRSWRELVALTKALQIIMTSLTLFLYVHVTPRAAR